MPDLACLSEVDRFADQLDRSFHGGAWHGLAVAEVLDGVDLALATRRPRNGGHTIHELVVHLAFWLDAARRRIDGEAVTGLAPDADWPDRVPTNAAEWQAVQAALADAHRRLHGRVRALSVDQLDQAVAGSDPSLRGLLFGVLQHNAYHAGQIVLLRKPEPGGGG